MIDLHSHILPGLDDGPGDVQDSIALAREAVAGGTKTMVATPHIRDDHPFALEEIESGVEDLNRALSDADVDLQVVAGGEVAISRVPDLDPASLQTVCLGPGPYMLVESPYSEVADLLENLLFQLQAKGFRPLLAHPERSPCFLSDFARLERLVERGVLCSVTAMSLGGRFGRTVQGFTKKMFAAGLVHNVASDTHDPRRRPPSLLDGFGVLDEDLPGLSAQAGWFTQEAPAAMLAGAEILPPRPAAPAERKKGLRGLFAGSSR